MSRQTLQCIGTSKKGPSESKGSISTQVDAVCAGEPAPNECVHNKLRPTAKPVPKPAGKDYGISKTTSSRSPKAKLNGTGRNTAFPARLLKDVTENGSGTAKWPGPDAPASTGSACEAGVSRQEPPALRAPMAACEAGVSRQEPPALRAPTAAQDCEEQVGATGPPSAACPVQRGGLHHSEDAYDLQADLQGDQSPSEEEEDGCCDEDERPARSAPLELLAEFLKAVMEKDYLLSQKLCLMILIYEPENPEAKLFMPLIEERLLIAQEAEEQRRTEEETASSSGEEEGDDEDDGDEEEEDDDDDDDEDDDDDSETSEGQTDSSESSCSSSEEDTEEERGQRSNEEYERCKRAAVIP